MTHARAIAGYPTRALDDVISILMLTVYIVAILALSAGVTWLVVKISPSESAKEQRRARKSAEQS
jgi:flagellar basal body-associated protein FliL